MAQFIGSWLDKLKMNRDSERRQNEIQGGDEYSPNVQFAMGLHRDDVDKDSEVKAELEDNNNNKKQNKKRKGKKKKEVVVDKNGLWDISEELKPLVDCR